MRISVLLRKVTNQASSSLGQRRLMWIMDTHIKTVI